MKRHSRWHVPENKLWEEAMDIKDILGRAGQGRVGQRLIGSIAITGLGLLAIAEATGYPLGSLRRIGPGAVPMGLGILLTCLGLAFFWDVPKYEDRVPGFLWRPLIAISAAMASFAFLVEYSGMFAAIFGLIGISEFAEREYSWKKVLITSVGLCLFIAGLKTLLSDSLILDLY
ncbi:hypothetical protein CDZ98_23775 [Mameliella alba]|nr:hypothetical protein CDZ98_23775 [Mameliella alba]